MKLAYKSMTMVLFATTIFSSAFLLFLVQPLISKRILPWFGGPAAVWARKRECTGIRCACGRRVFRSDSVPVHLITREAVAIYLRHMNPEGIIAFHVTNTFLSLAPVVQKIAADHGLYSVLIHDDAENSPLRRTDWV